MTCMQYDRTLSGSPCAVIRTEALALTDFLHDGKTMSNSTMKYRLRHETNRELCIINSTLQIRFHITAKLFSQFD